MNLYARDGVVELEMVGEVGANRSDATLEWNVLVECNRVTHSESI